MKTKSFILNLLLLSLLYSQFPVITRENYFKIGDKCLKTFNFNFDLEPYPISDTGKNIIWDFTNLFALKGPDRIDTVMVVEPQFTPFRNFESYLISNLCVVKDELQTDSSANRDYYYFVIDDSSLRFIGNWRDSYNNEQYFYNLADQITELKFPTTYGNKYTDSFDGKFLDVSGGLEVYRKGIFEYKVDSYGKILLPDNNFYDNTIRVKTKYIYTDSTSRRATKFSYTGYWWFSSESRGPLVHFKAMQDTLVLFAELFYNKVLTNIDENKQAPSQISALYPNPVFDISRIEFPNKNDEYSISVYNTVGELVKSEKVYSGNYVINRNDLPSGVYFILVRNRNEFIGAQKFLIVK